MVSIFIRILIFLSAGLLKRFLWKQQDTFKKGEKEENNALTIKHIEHQEHQKETLPPPLPSGNEEVIRTTQGEVKKEKEPEVFPEKTRQKSFLGIFRKRIATPFQALFSKIVTKKPSKLPQKEIPKDSPKKTRSLKDLKNIKNITLKDLTATLPALQPKIKKLSAFLQDKEWHQKLQQHRYYQKLFTPPAKKLTSTFHLIRPGEKKESWELWHFQGGTSSQETPADNTDKTSHQLAFPEGNPPSPEISQEILHQELLEQLLAKSSKEGLIAAIPTQELLIIPLWVSSQGRLEELVELELSSKQLLRRGIQEGVQIEKIWEEKDRILVTVQTPLNALSPEAAPFLQKATFFETALRLHTSLHADLLLWHELGKVCFAFMRNQRPVWFSATHQEKLSHGLLQQIELLALRLEAENVLAHPLKRLVLLGDFSPCEQELLQHFPALAPSTFQKNREQESPLEIIKLKYGTPLIPEKLLDLPPQEARHYRQQKAKEAQLKKVGMAALSLYGCFLLFFGLNLLIKKSLLIKLQLDLKHQEPKIEEAQKTIDSWHQFRSAIDPGTYALDLIATISKPIQGENIRLISISEEKGELRITGEATDVTEAYRFIDLIKKDPHLQEYQWSSSQPKLAGQHNVHFEMEGTTADAKTSDE